MFTCIFIFIYRTNICLVCQKKNAYMLYTLNHNSIFHSISLTPQKKAGDLPYFHMGDCVQSTGWPPRWVAWCQSPPVRWFLPRRKHACDRWSAPWRMWWCQLAIIGFFSGEAIENWDDVWWYGFCLVFIAIYFCGSYVYICTYIQCVCGSGKMDCSLAIFNK